MRDRDNRSNRIWFAGIYYILASVLYVIDIFIPSVYPGMLTTVFLFVVLGELIIHKKLKFVDFADRLVAAYFIYNAVSVIWLIKGGMPVSVYEQEFMTSLLPVMFYYAGRTCAGGLSTGKIRLFNIVLMIICIVVVFISGRQMAAAGVSGERSEWWIAAVNNMYSTWLGNGLGANGPMAAGIDGAHVIEDLRLIKIYCEQGIIGFSMFIYLMILSLRKCFGDIRKYCIELGIIVPALFLPAGSGMLAAQLTASVFWHAVGMISAETTVTEAES